MSEYISHHCATSPAVKTSCSFLSLSFYNTVLHFSFSACCLLLLLLCPLPEPSLLHKTASLARAGFYFADFKAICGINVILSIMLTSLPFLPYAA